MFVLLIFNAFSALATGKSKFLGNIVGSSVPSSWDTYWNQVTAENGCKWESVEGTRGSYNWAQCDVAADHAKSAGIPFKYHTFVWGSQEPSWLGNLGSADKKTAVENLIRAAASHYSPDYIDVVNEALHAPSNARDGLGGSGSTGWDWIVTAFTLARSAFPSSKLLINEYGIINDASEIKQYLQIVDALKAKNLIDGIGIQTHQFNVNDLSAATITSNLNTLAASGLPIYSSELDINGNSEANQAAIYQRVFPAIWEHSGVKGITLWGWITGQTWKDGTGIADASGNPRQALTWLKTYMASQ
uniref:endo-1,4-beta-xylanase n=1 Tax=uncultured symbiotic protist of Hodotermopsis sjoestedti TaxID=403659 RepID=A4UWT9_9EUKA|nr:putative glycosyl hydrolase family10 [uncultured symbiotic protist of Hodotermopsis sjoestedti]